jgi:exonuclease III
VEMGELQYFGKKSIDHAMTVMPDGNNRIQVVTMNSSHKNCCIVNVYMPSEAKEGDYEYKDNLDQLQEIIQKYDNSYQIIICGDMNASLHRDDRRRDNLFRNFIHENGLKLANNHPERPTFFHHNNFYIYYGHIFPILVL